jgi:hypothetical protein
VVWLPLLICVESTMTVFQLPWVMTLSWLPTAAPLAMPAPKPAPAVDCDQLPA